MRTVKKTLNCAREEPVAPQERPNELQVAPKVPQERPNELQGATKGAQEHPKGVPKWAKSVPKWIKISSKMVPERPKVRIDQFWVAWKKKIATLC